MTLAYNNTGVKRITLVRARHHHVYHASKDHINPHFTVSAVCSELSVTPATARNRSVTVVNTCCVQGPQQIK